MDAPCSGLQVLGYGQGACRAFTDSVLALRPNDAARCGGGSAHRSASSSGCQAVTATHPAIAAGTAATVASATAPLRPFRMIPFCYHSVLFRHRRVAADPSGSRVLEALLSGNAPAKVSS
jgi:hypothetical protein